MSLRWEDAMHPCTAEQSDALLQTGDPEPVVLVNASSKKAAVLVCEHAGRAIPRALGDLGLTEADLDRHIAYDIGAEKLSRMMAERLGLPLVLQSYSRLVVDCNRPVEAADAVPELSDAIPIRANMSIGAEQRQQRLDEIFFPFHEAVSEILDLHPRKAVFAIHSYTPVLGREERPWDLAFLFRKDSLTSRSLADSVKVLDPSLKIGMNEPYAIEVNADWFVPYHGERRGIAHSLIEVRNDHLGTDDACRRWASVLSAAIEQFLERMES